MTGSVLEAWDTIVQGFAVGALVAAAAALIQLGRRD